MLCNTGYLSKTYLKLKSRGISFVHSNCLSGPIVFTFCTEHGSDTAVYCAKCQDDWIIGTYVIHMLWTNDISRDLS